MNSENKHKESKFANNEFGWQTSSPTTLTNNQTCANLYKALEGKFSQKEQNQKWNKMCPGGIPGDKDAVGSYTQSLAASATPGKPSAAR